MNRNFKEIYEELNTKNLDEIKIMHKRKNVTLIILLVLTLILIFFNKIVFLNNIITVTFFLIFLFILLINISITIKFKRIFKEIIIKRIVKLYDKEISFYTNMGILESEYRKSGFYKDFDKYYSEDLFKGKLNNKYSFEMAQVRTKKIEIVRDDRGKYIGKEEHIVFDGLYGMVDLNGINLSEIDVATNTIISKYKNSRIEMDSAEFENNYDIFSKDKIKALEIFTSEIIDEINNFKTNIGKPIQIRIKNGKLFFNVYLGEILEPPTFKNIMDYDILYKYFKIIDQPINLISEILKNIDEIK